jgi:glutamine synthetase
LFALGSDEVRARGIRHLPRTLDRAVEELVTDDVLRAALGKTSGGDFVDYFSAVKQQEFDDYHASVSDWEVRRYLTQA